MENEPLKILKKYWNFDSFRPCQEEVIRSVLSDNDTLALMATGGGKSLCYQVPAMMKQGICIIISPLISLMKDQVDDLEKKGFKAKTINSFLFSTKIEAILNAAVNHRLKFLFIAPERIHSAVFLEAFKQMKVSMIVVDEAHCISLWGHDFRPAYLDIIKLRDYKPAVPVLALTATATEKVKTEIQTLLAFRKENVIQASFLRTNFRYMVFNEMNKIRKIVSIYHELKGSGIIYVRTRSGTEILARTLMEKGLNAQPYHAGLPIYERNARQEQWISGKLPLIVATTAFGMGINKADVRYVIHIDIPENMETYFQETGRAGRDGKETYAVLMYVNDDKKALKKRVAASFPDTVFVKTVYNALYNFYNIPFGAGKAGIFTFNIKDFVKKYILNPLQTFAALRVLERNGIIAFSEEEAAKSHAMFTVDMHTLKFFCLQYIHYNPLVDCLLRNYPAIFTEMTRIDERRIARATGLTTDQVIKYLKHLFVYDVLKYENLAGGQHITFLEDRLPDSHFALTKEFLQLKQLADIKAEQMLKFIETRQCRQQQILAHFGEKIAPCGKCDACQSLPTINNEIKAEILASLQVSPQHIKFFFSKNHFGNTENVTNVLRKMIDEGEVKLTENIVSTNL